MNRFKLHLRRASFLLPSGLTAGLWLKGLHPPLLGWACPLRRLTGIPCPTCFLTRATSAALTGDLLTATRLHAFGPVVAVALIWWSVLAIRQRRLLPQPLPAKLFGGSAVALVAYWLMRLLMSGGAGAGGRGGLTFPSG